MQISADLGETPVSPEERRRFLVERLRTDGRLVAAALAEELGTSEDTIRRDLRELAALGLVQRVHGGALPVSPAVDAFAVRSHQSVPAKESLAAAAVGLVRDGQTILLDVGTTNLALARALPPSLRVTVLTPSPPIAIALAQHPLAEVVQIGGRLDKANQSVVGSAAVDVVRSVRADLCLLGVCSLDADAGITVIGYEESHLKRAMMASSAETVALVTADKLGTAAPHVVGPARDLDRLITERSAPTAALDPLTDCGIAVTLA